MNWAHFPVLNTNSPLKKQKQLSVLGLFLLIDILKHLAQGFKVAKSQSLRRSMCFKLLRARNAQNADQGHESENLQLYVLSLVKLPKHAILCGYTCQERLPSWPCCSFDGSVLSQLSDLQILNHLGVTMHLAVSSMHPSTGHSSHRYIHQNTRQKNNNMLMRVGGYCRSLKEEQGFSLPSQCHLTV